MYQAIRRNSSHLQMPSPTQIPGVGGGIDVWDDVVESSKHWGIRDLEVYCRNLMNF